MDKNFEKDFSSFVKELKKRGIDFKRIFFLVEEFERQGLDFESFLELIKEDKDLAKELFEFVKVKLQPDSVDAVYLASWKKVYKEWFDMDINISGLKVPENYDPEKHFLVLVAKDITMNAVVKAMKKRFNVYLSTEDLDSSVTKNDRNPQDGNYLVLFNRNIEADEEFKNMSANDLAKKGHKGITLFERLLLEVLYYNKTKEHLDINNWTLCSGSRFSDGHVPCVHWYSGHGKLNVFWYFPDGSGGGLGSRSVVS